MGLVFYMGASGSGKSHELHDYIIKEAMKNPHRNYLIVVPDQFTMQTQLDVVKMHPNKGIMNIDVLSFGRLSHRIFEEVGGNNKPVLDDTGKSLILRRVAAGTEEELSVMKKNVKRIGYIHEVKSAISEFMQYGLGVNEVEKLVEYSAKRGILSKKLQDLHILYNGFLEFIKEKYITTEETLDILRGVLPKSKIVKDSVIAFDGFTGFTPVQNKVIQELLCHANEVIVTITMDTRQNPYEMDGEQKLFHLSKKTIHDLEKLTGMNERELIKRRENDVIIKGDVHRFKENEALLHLERELFRYPSRSFEKEQNSIHIFEASNPKEELRQVCLEIKRLIREQNYCYRDIAVITGDMERYSFAAKEMFERFGIPYFIDQTTRLVLNPFIEFIRSALLVVIQDYSYESVFHFLRCGLSGVEADDVDKLENYIITMGLRGRKAWTSKFSRRMKNNDKEDELEAQRLEKLDAIREHTATMLEPLMIKEATGEEFVRSLYDFIVKAGIEEKLGVLAQQFTDEGDFVKAKEYSQIYRLVMDLLDQIIGLLGNETMQIKEFADILDAGFAEIKVGIIPQNVDKIVIGDIERTRLNEVKTLFFIGVNDGIIPKTAGGGGIISDIDREFLLESDFELAPTPRQQMYIQRLYLYLIMTKPTQRLYVSCAKVDNDGKSIRPSYLVNVLTKLYPQLEIKRPELSGIDEQMESFDDSFGYLISMLRDYAADRISDNKKLFFTIYDTYVENEKYAAIINQLKKGAFFSYSERKLPKELAVMLYGKILKNSVSRLEKFASCAYAHFLQYGLRLEERDKYSFENVDMGNIFHEVLSEFSEQLTKEGYTWFDFPQDVGERLVGQCLESYASTYGETILHSSKRNEYIITKMHRILNRTISTLQYQLRKGVFTPENFEMSFQMTSDLDAVNIALSEDEKLELVGRIDRVDTYRENDKIYVKIIDYKSGKKSFDLAALYYGLQLQLVVYMNAAMESEKKNNPDSDVIPAGMLYYHISDPMVETSKGQPDPVEIQSEILKELKLSGVVNDNDEVIKLLDKDFVDKSEILPIRKKKDGSFYADSSILSNADFETITKYVNNKIKEIGTSILDGDISLNPYEAKKTDACAYCSYKSICGFDKRLGRSLVRELDDMDQNEALERIHESVNEKGREE